jgi:hypothetical protein
MLKDESLLCTTVQITDMIRKIQPVCLENQQGFCLSISGFDDDPRELYQIREVIEFTKRLVKLGFMSCLHVTTTIKDLIPEPFKSRRLPGLGALELWLFASEQMKPSLELDKSTFQTFVNDLEASNKIVEYILNPSQVPDAPVKYQGRRS